jgi:hypothetical protein
VLVFQQTALVAATLTALLVATLLGVCVKGKVEVSDPIRRGRGRGSDVQPPC